jgi:glycosyltransferase involved in cell wall biosynthesis
MSTIKVLHVIARMNVGGTARYVGDLVANIPDSVLATGYVQGEEVEDSIVTEVKILRVKHLGRKISPVNDLKAYFELWSIVRKIRPEIVHTHTFKAGLLGRFVPGNHKRVHTFHGHLFEDSSFSRLQKQLITISERFLALRSDVLISVGTKVGSDLRKSKIGRTKRWLSIPPGIKPVPTIDRYVARKLLNLPSDDFLVGWMARVTSVKNPNLLVDIARRLPELKFVMAGGGDLLEDIRSNAPQNLKILGWVQASIFWSAINLGLSTSDNEGIPIALIEAQRAGVPVLATNVGSVSEIILDGVTGKLSSRNCDSIVEELIQLVNNPLRLESMAKAASFQATQNFDLNIMIAAHANVYRSL